MVFTVLLLLCFVLLLTYVKLKNSNYWTKRNIVQENNVFWKFILSNRSLSEIYKQIYDKYPTEPHVGMCIGSDPHLLLRDLENIQAVLAGDFQNFYSRGIVISKNDVLGDNVLFIDEYSRWKIIRQKLSPYFSSLKLKNMFYIMEKLARDFVEVVEQNPAMVEKPFQAMYIYTVASIGKSIFGNDANLRYTMDSPFFDMAWRSVAPSFKANLGFIMGKTFPILADIVDIKPFEEYKEFFVGVVKSVLESRKNITEKHNDFIEICLKLQSQGIMKDVTTGYKVEPTDEFLAAQAFFFFVAGADTSANAMHYTLLELSNNQNILKRVHEEIDEVFTKCNENVTFDDVEQLRYLDMVINEALRMYPPIGLMNRKCTNDTVLPVGNVKIRKGISIVIPVYAIHRDKRYFPDPEKFTPERFSSENISTIPKFSYLPFGDGNRICLGMRFARLQVKVGLAWILRRFTLRKQSHKPQKFEPSLFSLRAPDACYDLLPRNL